MATMILATDFYLSVDDIRHYVRPYTAGLPLLKCAVACMCEYTSQAAVVHA